MLASTTPAALKSRNGADATRWFPEVVRAFFDLPPGCILDGEVAVLDELGRSDFDRLHARAGRRGWYAGADLVAYCVFDLLAFNGKDLRGQPIEQRKRRLRQVLADPRPGLLFVDWVDNGAALYQAALALHLEGIVGKRAASLYVGERSTDWVKIKRPGAIPPERFRHARRSQT